MIATFLSTFCLPALTAASAERATPVTLERTAEGYTLLKDGEPYTIHGAGGTGNIELLVEYGGNTIRTWDAEGIRPLMDEAHEHGVSVLVGIWLAHQRHGYDHSDMAVRKEQAERVRKFVLEFRDHPALLGWGVGNELELNGDFDIALEQIQIASRIIKSLDEHHPTFAIIAELGEDKAVRVLKECPDIDILGVNSYAQMGSVADRLLAQGYDGPYVVTEFGPVGHWETESTPWGAPYEQSSSEKAAFIGQNFQSTVVDHLGGQCLGSFAFLWGNKQEKTETWFGLILPTGETTQTVDMLSTHWTGSEPDNLAPLCSGIEIHGGGNVFEPGEQIRCRVKASDPDGDRLRFEWRVIPESGVLSVGGDFEQGIKPMDLDITVRDEGAVIMLPERRGAYRVFVTVRDGEGHAGTANVPIHVGPYDR